MFLWIVVLVLVVSVWGDRGYLLQVADGVDPRLLVVAEVVPVLGACCLPAVAWPRLWSWERRAPRLLVRVVAGSLCPLALLLVGLSPALARSWGIALTVTQAHAQLCNALAFGCVALLAGVRWGRNAGPLAGVVAYFSGVMAQGLAVDAPLPFRAGDPGPLMAVVGSGALLVSGICLAGTLGRHE